MRVERVAADAVMRDGPVVIAAQLRARVRDGDSVAESVREIIATVRAQGDAAVERYTRELDTAGGDPLPIRVTEPELDDAIRTLPREVVAGLQVAISNVAAMAQTGLAEDRPVELPQGQRIVMREVPVASAAIYVPGGRAPYPSTVVMGVVTARAAGVLDVSVCSPPGRGGDVHPTVLGTCRLCGVESVYRMGGAQAIAALAYGTPAVRPVQVIAGPGNLYVQEAKLQVSHRVGIDGFAGPSDLLVVAAPGADPHLMALDLAAQAEHGPGTLVGALSADWRLLEAVEHELEAIAAAHPQLEPAACVLIHTPDTNSAIAISNEFAPEHLQLVGAEAESLARLVSAAGCVFVGDASATAFGDYVAGSNHVLPTGGAARFASSLSPRHFRRRMAEVHIGDGAGKLAAAGAPIARAEGFQIHAESMLARAEPGRPGTR